MVRTEKQAGPNDAAKASAAAMDALNLDDLFLGNDDHGADSLFADMDIDLGDMDGIIGEAAEGGLGFDGLRDVLSAEFGGGGFMGSRGTTPLAF